MQEARIFSLLSLLLLPLPHHSLPAYPLPPGCSFTKLPHSYGFWGCTRPTGGVCGLKRQIVCDSSYRSSPVLKKTPPKTPTKAPSVPGTNSPTLPDPSGGYNVQANIKTQPLGGGQSAPENDTRRKEPRLLSSNLVLALLCSTRYWLPPCQSLPSQALEIVRKNLLQGINATARDS